MDNWWIDLSNDADQLLNDDDDEEEDDDDKAEEDDDEENEDDEDDDDEQEDEDGPSVWGQFVQIQLFKQMQLGQLMDWSI